MTDDRDDARAASLVAALATWSALASRSLVCEPPLFVERGSSEPIDTAAFAARLAAETRPVRIVATPKIATAGAVGVAVVPVASIGSGEQDATSTDAHPVVRRLPSVIPGTSPGDRVLVVGGSRRLRVRWSAIAAAHRDYWLDLPTTHALDESASPWANGMRIPAAWIAGVAHLVAFGRSRATGGTIRVCIAANVSLDDG